MTASTSKPLEAETVSKTVNETIEGILSSIEIGGSKGPRPWTAAIFVDIDAFIAALDDAGFIIVSKEEIRKELADATASDNWHKYGEGYGSLRRYLEKLIGETPPSGDR